MTKKPTATYDAFDVVAVPFPFTDRNQAKKRPALVLSSAKNFNESSGHGLLAMITSAKNRHWPLDVSLNNLKEAGLAAPSVVRMKLFTLDFRIITRRLGCLDVRDRKAVKASLGSLLADV